MKLVNKLEESVLSAYEEFGAEVRRMHEQKDFSGLLEIYNYLDDGDFCLLFELPSMIDSDREHSARLASDSLFELIDKNSSYKAFVLEKVLQDEEISSEKALKSLGYNLIHFRFLVKNPSWERFLHEDPLFLVKAVKQIEVRRLESEPIKVLICKHPEAVKTLLQCEETRDKVCRIVDHLIISCDAEKTSDDELAKILRFASDNSIKLSRIATLVKKGIEQS